ncbi:DHHA1 domain-containing protein [Planotetraspora sp. A-T 1434]|uniref:DHHA1 domain-containing protein n=1 Tax=Planotetraspora sp. A-T 1434 TaxID=2979219 RepID=UPI0021C1921B|nr:DHHA1 domain-containing protein [Planotetraspora sp. A-T 1434]MCT9933018.1 DHHA1 domain-containing protein [Planotetraspora sp. A-T 1434]
MHPARVRAEPYTSAEWDAFIGGVHDGEFTLATLAHTRWLPRDVAAEGAGPVLPAATASVIANLGNVWPELTAQSSLIEQVVTAEEEHARQQGSLVDAGWLRFDFAHFSAVDPTQLAAVEALVNDHLMDDPEVRIWHTTRVEAEAAGATALFGEKYGDQVRIVDIGDISRELCGGTHVGHGAGAGPVRVLGESSIGSNLRRIEALTGRDVLLYYDSERRLLQQVASLLGTRPKDAPDVLRKRLGALAEAQDELGRLRAEELRHQAVLLADTAQQSGGGWIVAQKVTGIAPDELRALATDTVARVHGGHSAVVLGLEHEGKAVLVAAVSYSVLDSGIEAQQILTEAARVVGGGAGGKPGVAQAGGRRPEALDQALMTAFQDAARLFA